MPGSHDAGVPGGISDLAKDPQGRQADDGSATRSSTGWWPGRDSEKHEGWGPEGLRLRRATKIRRGWLKNGNRPGDFSKAPRCGAKTKRGRSCECPAMANGRLQQPWLEPGHGDANNVSGPPPLRQLTVVVQTAERNDSLSSLSFVIRRIHIDVGQFSRETNHFSSGGPSACVPSLEPPLARTRSASESSLLASSKRPNWVYASARSRCGSIASGWSVAAFCR